MTRSIAVVALAVMVGCGDDPDPMNPESLRNGTYLLGNGGSVTLVEGAYEFPEGGELKRVELIARAEGDLDGDGDADGAVVLAEEATNSTILRLHALVNDGREARDVVARILGDRVGVRSVSIDDGIISADLLVRREREPVVVEPSVPVSIRFALTETGLLPVDPPRVVAAAEATTRSGAPETTLTSNEWELSGIETGDEAIAIESLERVPALRFTTEPGALEGSTGRVYGFAGCNRIFGEYRADAAGTMGIRRLSTTRRACEGAERDVEERVIAGLVASRTHELADAELTIRFDGGLMRFRRGGELVPDTGGARPESEDDGARAEGRSTA